MNKFKIGNNVRVLEVTADDLQYGLSIGSEGEVIDDNTDYPEIRFGYGETYCFYEDDLELIDEE